MDDTERIWDDKPSLPDGAEKSEEVQAIIDRMPTQWTKWVVGLLCLLMGLIFILGYAIKYPDTVDGDISITAQVAPVRLVAGSSGRLSLLQPDKSKIQKGGVIAYLESGANYKHLLSVDSLLRSISCMDTPSFPVFPDTFLLGEMSASYNAFVTTFSQYRRLLSSDIYSTMRRNLQNQIASDKKIIVNLQQELQLKQEILTDSENQLRKDSLLLSAGGISEKEYQEHRSAHLAFQSGLLALHTSIFTKQSEISKNELENQRIILEETENKEKIYTELIARKNELANAITLWRERYLIYAPIAGELEYLGFWRNNSFVQSGRELFSVIPEKGNIIGEVYIPSFGAGKVKPRQLANVKIDNFPYDEYGLLQGVVQSISRIANKVETKEGSSDAYLITVSFPQGAKSNFGIELPLDFETKGKVEIITKRKRLIERLFDNLKSRMEK